MCTVAWLPPLPRCHRLGGLVAQVAVAAPQAAEYVIESQAAQEIEVGSQVVAQMASISRFGMLVAATIGLALLADLILVPAVLRFFYPMQAKEE